MKEDLLLWWRRKRARQAAVDPKADSHFWALKDIGFEIRQGDVVGLIGKNGAGKSTLLKIISRITLPTSGVIRGKGRIASLLEVGTGFHPELTGRENILLNGSILGMTKKEIESRFDEIIDFSGVEAFLDTPVKRYSSGMYVRLAFSIAIHLDPDILILDEVLSVGDFDFQQKCLAKIEDISKKQGQTILFVSHNMQSVKSLCNTALYLEKGKLIAQGNVSSVVSKYLLRENVYVHGQKFTDKHGAPGNDVVRISEVEIRANNHAVSGPVDTQAELAFRVSFWKLGGGSSLIQVRITVINFLGEGVFSSISEEKYLPGGIAESICQVPGGFLAGGSYIVNFAILANYHQVLFEYNQGLSFEMKSSTEPLAGAGRWPVPVYPNFPFTLH
ncbi:ABC transporter ATP-binding protein [Parapedobacter soli]|uniref:ABC transporter ATP-binding protein n=1 Tax=Parapedobacter soli TaxID=416955 RepID=UPI0021CA54A9|nr:polysaccharide ABC transporter ATP-binding protein [Parapedobacter soli]